MIVIEPIIVQGFSIEDYPESLKIPKDIIRKVNISPTVTNSNHPKMPKFQMTIETTERNYSTFFHTERSSR